MMSREAGSPGDEPSPGVLAPAESPLLEVGNLGVEFVGRQHTVKAVDGMDLSLDRGEVLALVGESGSGKTLTALSIAGILPKEARVTSGSVVLEGRDLFAMSDAEMNEVRGKRIGMLFQNPRAHLDPTSKVGDQVGEAYRLHRGASSRQAWRRSIELLADVGIPEPERRAESYAHQLSGGMAQRVMIAAALAGEPDLLIADEPTTALDVTIQAQVLHLLLGMKRDRGLSMLFITHDLGIVSSFADRVVVMYAGRAVESGPARALMADSEHPYTKALLQSSMLVPKSDGYLYAIPGGPPQPGEELEGCRFRPRCGFADELGIAAQCESREPPMIACDDGHHHQARCWATASEELQIAGGPSES